MNKKQEKEIAKMCHNIAVEYAIEYAIEVVDSVFSALEDYVIKSISEDYKGISCAGLLQKLKRDKKSWNKMLLKKVKDE